MIPFYMSIPFYSASGSIPSAIPFWTIPFCATNDSIKLHMSHLLQTQNKQNPNSVTGHQMLLHKLHLLKKSFSTSTSSTTTTAAASLIWRNEIKQTQIANQISSILLQRKNWVPLLSTFNLSLNLNESLFHTIILKTKSNPQISLGFFNWVKSSFEFHPSVKSLSKLIQISIQSGFSQQAVPILDSLIQTLPVATVLDSTVESCRGTDSHGIVLSFVIECYAHKGLCLDALKVFDEMKLHHGHVITIQACNALLDALLQHNKIRLAWCFLGRVIRNEASPDSVTWSIVARILAKEEKLEQMVTLFDSGICCDSAVFSLIIDGYCKRGDFQAAFAMLNEDCANKKLNPGFSTYSSILDGACMYQNVSVIETTIGLMISKNMLPKNCTPEYDSVIQKFCNTERPYAAKLFYERASDEEIPLHDMTHGCMLSALSKGGRLKEAICLYRKISTTGVILNDSVCVAFVDLLCKEVHQTEETEELLIEMIRKGFVPRASDLSSLFNLHSRAGKWQHSEDLLSAILEKNSLPDMTNCSSLVLRYCSTGKLDLAMALHDKVAKMNGCLDSKSYNVLLARLFTEKRVDEAVCVFDYMRQRSLVDSESFTTMIKGLCCEKEMRKAMKLHDEMMKLKLKPDQVTYKRLILGFQSID